MKYTSEAIKLAIEEAKSASPYAAVIEVCQMLEDLANKPRHHDLKVRRPRNDKKRRGHRR